MSDCLFCKIVNKEMEADIVYEDDEIVAFKDINPAAPIHILIIPRKHFDSLIDVQEDDALLMGKLHLIANHLAGIFNIKERGFRIVINCGQEGGQAIGHLHLHLLGGKPLNHNIAEGRGV